jgi:hypothetical protein
MANHFIDSREERSQERRLVGLVVTKDKVDRKRVLFKHLAFVLAGATSASIDIRRVSCIPR